MAKTEKLVKGYVVEDYSQFPATEVLFALTQSGKLYQSDKHPISPSFCRNWKWQEVKELPEKFDYIGNYHYPVGVTD